MLSFYVIILLFGAVVCSSDKWRGPDIKTLDTIKQLTKVKVKRNGSVVLFFKQKDIEFEERMVRAANHVSKYGVGLYKVNCPGSKSFDVCRLVDKKMVMLYKRGETKTLKDGDVKSTNMAINSILFFVAAASFEKLVYCGTMDQLNQVIDLDRGILNTVVASFNKHDSEYIRRYLEAAIESGDKYGYILLDVDAPGRPELNKHGFFVTLYYTKHANKTEKIRTKDISNSIQRSNDIAYYLMSVELAEEMQIYAEKSAAAQKEQDEMVARVKMEAMEEFKQNSLYGGGRDRENEKLARDLLNQRGGRPSKMDFLKLTDRFLLNKVKKEVSEIGYDAFTQIDRQSSLMFYKTKLLLDLKELEKVIAKVNKSKNEIVLIMFHVPWDPVYQMFEKSFYELAVELKGEKHKKIYHFDCYSWLEGCRDMKINQFPTIKVFKSALPPLEYKGFLSKEDIKQFLHLVDDPFMPTLSDKRQLEEISAQMKDECVIFGLFQKDASDDELEKIFERVSYQFFGKIRIGKLTIDAVKKSLKVFDTTVNLPAVIAINANFVMKKIHFINDWNEEALTEWMSEQFIKQVEELTPYTFPSLLKLNKPFLISIRKNDKSRKSLKRFAEKNPQVITTWMDSEKQFTKSIHLSYGLQTRDAIILLDKQKNKVYEYGEKKRSVELITDWVKSCCDDKNQPTYIIPEVTWPGKDGYDFLGKLDNLTTTSLEKGKLDNVTSSEKGKPIMGEEKIKGKRLSHHRKPSKFLEKIQDSLDAFKNAYNDDDYDDDDDNVPVVQHHDYIRLKDEL